MPNKLIAQHWVDSGGNISKFAADAKADGFSDSDINKEIRDRNKPKENTSNQPSSPFQQLYKAEQGQSIYSGLQDRDTIDVTGLATKTGLYGEIIKQVKLESDLHTQINERIGLTGELSENFRASIVKSLPVAASLGYGFENVANMIAKMNEQSGRFNLISEDTLKNTYAVSRAFVGDLASLADYFTEFEKIGQGAFDTLDAISRSGQASLSLGLNSKKTTDLLRGNIEKLNEYGFKNGIDGLNRMVQRSIELRMNLGEVFKVADQVMDPEKAIALTANLQVLGGAIGDFNDPMKLMYMATNNVEGLQKALFDAAGSLATYNSEQGRFEITGVNLRRAREMAAQLGVDYKELAKAAIAGQERQIVNNQLLAKGLNIPKEDREFITNMSQMKNGQMSITLPKDVANELGMQTEIAIRDLTAPQIEQLRKVKEKLEDTSPEQIARGQFTSIANIEMMMQGIYRQVVTTATNLTLGAEGVNVKELFKELDTSVKEAYTRVTAQSPDFENYVKSLYSTSLAGAKTLLGPAAEGFKSVTQNAIQDFIRNVGNSKKMSPEDIQMMFITQQDKLNKSYNDALRGNLNVVTQHKLTVQNNSSYNHDYVLNETRRKYVTKAYNENP